MYWRFMITHRLCQRSISFAIGRASIADPCHRVAVESRRSATLDISATPVIYVPPIDAKGVVDPCPAPKYRPTVRAPACAVDEAHDAAKVAALVDRSG